MQCLACDANYATKGLTKSGTAWNMAINKGTCTRVKTECYEYLRSQEDMGYYVRDMGNKMRVIERGSELQDANEKILDTMDGTDS